MPAALKDDILGTQVNTVYPGNQAYTVVSPIFTTGSACVGRSSARGKVGKTGAAPGARETPRLRRKSRDSEVVQILKTLDHDTLAGQSGLDIADRGRDVAVTEDFLD